MFKVWTAETAFNGKAINADCRQTRSKGRQLPNCPERPSDRSIGREAYRWCYLIDNFFTVLKEFKDAIMRADKSTATLRDASRHHRSVNLRAIQIALRKRFVTNLAASQRTYI